MSDLVYLATPYSSPDKQVELQRYDAARWYTAKRIAAGELIFSPIVHSHPLVAFDVGGDWKTWAKWDSAMLTACDRFRILCLPGWEKSVGIAAERDYAHELRKPVLLIMDSPMATRIADGEFHSHDAAGVWSLDLIKLQGSA